MPRHMSMTSFYFYIVSSSSIYWTGPLQGVESPVEASALGHNNVIILNILPLHNPQTGSHVSFRVHSLSRPVYYYKTGV